MIRIEVAGESALILYFADTASAEVSACIQQVQSQLHACLGDALVDMVPSYASLLVIFNPLVIDALAVKKAAREIYAKAEATSQREGRVVELPVYYHPEVAPDLEALAERAGLSPDDVIRLHSDAEYRVYAIGFAPGFAYLGEVDARIAAPRLSTPRLKVPRGAVAIADRQTAVYPAVSPGGWNLIGRCPTRMFDPAAEPTMPVQVGDRVRFVPVDRNAFLAAGGEI